MWLLHVTGLDHRVLGTDTGRGEKLYSKRCATITLVIFIEPFFRGSRPFIIHNQQSCEILTSPFTDEKSEAQNGEEKHREIQWQGWE